MNDRGRLSVRGPNDPIAMSARPDSGDSGERVGAPRPSQDTRLETNQTPEPSSTKVESPGDVTNRLLIDERGQAENIGAVILGIGIAVVIGFVVLFIANEVMMMTNVSEGDPLYPAYEALQEATNNTFELFGLLFLVVVLSIAIVYLWRAQGNR